MKTCSVCGEDIDFCGFCKSNIAKGGEVICYSNGVGDETHFCSDSCWESYVIEKSDGDKFTGEVVDEGEEG